MLYTRKALRTLKAGAQVKRQETFHTLSCKVFMLLLDSYKLQPEILARYMVNVWIFIYTYLKYSVGQMLLN